MRNFSRFKKKYFCRNQKQNYKDVKCWVLLVNFIHLAALHHFCVIIPPKLATN